MGVSRSEDNGTKNKGEEGEKIGSCRRDVQGIVSTKFLPLKQ